MLVAGLDKYLFRIVRQVSLLHNPVALPLAGTMLLLTRCEDQVLSCKTVL